jgi:methylthioribose-1-phosphate isomerase
LVNFFTERTVRWENGAVIMIDQRQLPNHLTYLRCIDHQQVAKAILEMNVRGAPAIGVAAAMGLALAANNSKADSKQQLLDEMQAARRDLVETRPTAANLVWGVNRIYRCASEAEGSIKIIKQIVVDEAQRMADEDVDVNRSIGRNGASLLDDGDVVLTHCK